jgi:HEAT repeat protein
VLAPALLGLAVAPFGDRALSQERATPKSAIRANASGFPAPQSRDLPGQIRALLLQAGPDRSVGTDAIVARLVDLGAASIPALIDAIETQRLPLSGDSSARPLEPLQEEVAVAALSRFSKTALSQRLGPALLRVRSLRARSAFVRVVGAVGDRGDLLLLCQAVRPPDDFTDLDPELGRSIERAAAEILERDAAAFSTIQGCLHDEPAATRFALFRSLSGTAMERGLEILCAQLGAHPEEDVVVLRQVAREAASVPLPVADSILACARPYLHKDDPSLAKAAAECAGRLVDTEAVGELIDLLRHPHPDVQLEAHRALESITGVHLLADPERWSRWLLSENEWLVKDVPRLVSDIAAADPAAKVAAITEMSGHPLFRRELAVTLERELAHQTPQILRIGCAALRQLDAASAVPFLERCTKDSDPGVAAEATRALESMRRMPASADTAKTSP